MYQGGELSEERVLSDEKMEKEKERERKKLVRVF